MSYILGDFNKITNDLFYKETYTCRKDLEEFLDIHYNESFRHTIDNVAYDVYNEPKSNSITIGEILITEDGIYLKEWYDLLELEAKYLIATEMYKRIDEGNDQPFIKQIIQELEHNKQIIDKFQIADGIQEHKSYILGKLHDFIAFLSGRYMKSTDSSELSLKKAYKIKWLGQKNVLGTLIYDLWKGQESSKGVYTKKLIDAESKDDLISFIIDNFIDVDGNPFTYSSVSDYLSDSINKRKSKAKAGVRIEIITP